jgi:hypothetical protein
MSIRRPDLPVSCNRRTETVSMGTMNGSRRTCGNGASIAKLIPTSTTVALTHSSENHQYSARRARPENVDRPWPSCRHGLPSGFRAAAGFRFSTR